ncbi:non-ribosomal peptide synthetase [Lentzea albidocapillata]|uniref:non-ribosomal peptide synthetase n=1 Tax=Lentzea albidocapillata TaxID=40571 RepID=UPI00118453E1|nr:non-ribosomal peptide synthetase [Lentzea albidocapillata]
MRPLPDSLFAKVEQLAAKNQVSVAGVLGAAFRVMTLRCGSGEPVDIRLTADYPVRRASCPAPGSPFTVLLSEPHAEAAQDDTAGARFSGYRRGTAAHVDLHLEADLSNGGAVLHWHQEGEWGNPVLARLLPGYFETLLAAVVTRPEAWVAELPLMTSAQEAALERICVPLDRFPVTTPAHERVEEQARERPDAEAAADGAESLTYRQLNSAANRLARVLRSQGAAPQRTVALLMDRSTDMLVAFVAVMKTGAATVLLDPAHPVARLEQVVRDTQPIAVVSLARLGIAAFAGQVPVLCVDAERDRIAAEPDGDLGVRIHPDMVAYVVHTSGSTGVPKRVAVTHRSVAHSLQTHEEGHRAVPDDRASWLSPPGSSVSVGELWPYLAAGAGVHVAKPDVAAAPEALRDWLVADRITKTYVSMPMAESLFTLPWPDTAALRLLTVGSDTVRRWPAADLPFEVAVAYGSSEANGITSCLVPWDDRVTSRTATPAQRQAVPPVGRPWSGVRLRILDDDMRPVPLGVLGEVYVGGPELALGYLGAPGLTADRFVPDPFGPDGERLYRTGDLGWLDDDGLFHHRGRVDREIKVRGFRVNPAEIEAVLLAHPEVDDVVVVAVPHPDGSRQLAAYVVGRAEADELRGHLTARLPAHLVPAAYRTVGDLPRRVNGKVDRQALPPVEWVSANAQAPQDEFEEVAVQCFTDVLKIDRIGVDDDFFVLGGDSLAAARVVARINETVRRRVSVRDLLKNSTPKALAGVMRTGKTRHRA